MGLFRNFSSCQKSDKEVPEESPRCRLRGVHLAPGKNSGAGFLTRMEASLKNLIACAFICNESFFSGVI